MITRGRTDNYIVAICNGIVWDDPVSKGNFSSTIMAIQTLLSFGGKGWVYPEREEKLPVVCDLHESIVEHFELLSSQLASRAGQIRAKQPWLPVVDVAENTTPAIMPFPLLRYHSKLPSDWFI